MRKERATPGKPGAAPPNVHSLLHFKLFLLGLYFIFLSFFLDISIKAYVFINLITSYHTEAPALPCP